MKILDVRIDNLTKKEILEKIEFFLNENSFHQIATVNPEFILRAQQNEIFKNILNGCSLNVADGIGLKYAFVRFGKWLKCRFAGVDLMHEILRVADKKKLSVFLAINKNGLSEFEEINKALKFKYPNIKISGKDYDLSHQSSVISHQDEPNNDCQLPIADDCILFCNFGAPFQEVFINSVKNDSIRLAMGVGGSFDFLTGKVKRAPEMMRMLGLEWLWRLFLQPQTDSKFLMKRWKRIYNAVVVFPIKIISSK